MQLQIVHEAEVHRQHVRLKIPIVVEIDGTRFNIEDWSMGGFGIESEMSSRQPGERFPVRMIFPFEDFEVSLRLDCQMVYIVEDNSRFGCRFLGLSQGQLALFRYLIDAYLSGEIVSGGDILAIAGRDNSAEARINPLSFNPYSEEEAAGRRAKRLVGFGLLGLAGLALLGLTALGFKDRFLTPVAESAVIEAPIFRVRATANGILDGREIVDLLRRGDQIGSISTDTGQTARIESPCECAFIEWLALPGQYVQAGEPVAALVAADRPLMARAQVDLAVAERLQLGDVAEIIIAGRGESLFGQIERIDVKPRLAQLDPAQVQTPVAARLAQVIIRPDKPFSFEDLGSLARVRFP
ncbi:MAG TPA: PilZ domain-containing protein [Geminicoccaceae bacterium]|nr:PilZ domain-containing protein [Geminicoccus sp.]HMU49743.1 PilZ domain-containing protein [Geminicoccaceae bacterium]